MSITKEKLQQEIEQFNDEQLQQIAEFLEFLKFRSIFHQKAVERLERNRPMRSVTINIPEDVVEDLKRIAPLLGFSDYQPLIRAYIGQGLRQDLERFESATVTALIASLKRRGVSDQVIDEALKDVVNS